MAIYSKSFSSLKLFKPTLLSAGILACSISQAATLEETDVNSSTLKLPQITVDGVNYKRISFQYAVSGKTKIKSKSVLKETLQCHGKSVKNDYLKITYQGPKVIFRIEDHWRDRDLYVDTISTKGVTYFGQNDCDRRDRPDAEGMTDPDPCQRR